MTDLTAQLDHTMADFSSFAALGQRLTLQERA